jgi:cation transport regulator ChaB
MPAKDELPSTLQRSPKKAQETWSKAHDSAVEEYGEGERAHRTAFAALKHGFEKVGDHWEGKDEKGPSDKQAKKSGSPARKGGEPPLRRRQGAGHRRSLEHGQGRAGRRDPACERPEDPREPFLTPHPPSEPGAQPRKDNHVIRDTHDHRPRRDTSMG